MGGGPGGVQGRPFGGGEAAETQPLGVGEPRSEERKWAGLGVNWQWGRGVGGAWWDWLLCACAGKGRDGRERPGTVARGLA